MTTRCTNEINSINYNTALCEIRLEGVERRLDETARLLRRLECRIMNKPIPDALKDLVFDEVSPNGRLI
jgi:hypothetical protein